MARKKITADLNGGDAITAMADLEFQLHDGTTDAIIATANYAAIGSVNTHGTDGANITYTLNPTGGAGGLGQIILDGVDIGLSSSVKIRAKDESGNEGALSSEFSAATYKISMTKANAEQIVIPFSWAGAFRVRVYYDTWTGASADYVLGNTESNSNNTESAINILAGFSNKLNFILSNEAGSGQQSYTSPLSEVKPAWAEVEYDGINLISLRTEANGLVAAYTNANYAAAAGAELFIGSFGNALYSTCSVSKIEIEQAAGAGTHTFIFKTGSGATQESEEGGLTATLESGGGVINDMWVAL